MADRIMKVLIMMALPVLTGIAGFFGFSDQRDGEVARVYVGTYTSGSSEGLYVLDLDLSTGELSSARVAAKAVNPSFLAIHPTGHYLYAVNEIVEWDGRETGAVSAFGIDRKSGDLTLLNQKESGGGAPCFLTIDGSGRFVLVANYAGGSVASLPIGHDGQLDDAVSVVHHSGSSVNPDRQEGPHAHSINLDAANRFALAADLGLDEVLVYRFDRTSGQLTPNDPPSSNVEPGAGPRHLSFHPTGRYAYLVNELDLTIDAFAYDAGRGSLTSIQTVSTLPDSARSHAVESGYSTAEIRVHPSGRFVYASNRGHNTIAVFAVDESNGRLTPVEYKPTGGRNPRNFAIDPTGQFLLAANQNSDSIVVFRIDHETGAMVATGHTATVPRPVCVRFLAP